MTNKKDNFALELKREGKGIVSGTGTKRGKMGIEGKMIAATGFQREGYNKQELISIFINTLKSTDKLFEYFEYTRKSIREKDIFVKGVMLPLLS